MISLDSLRRPAALLLPALLGAALTWQFATPDDGVEAVEYRSGNYRVDQGHSTVRFGILHLGVANFYGRFNALDGSYVLDKDDPSENSITFVVDATSVDTNSKDRDDHLRNEDFFNVEKHERMTFDSTSCERTGSNTFALKGDLTLVGETKEVEVEATLIGAGDTPFRDYRSGVEATFSFSRSEFGISYFPAGLGDEISVVVSLEGILRQ